MADEMLLDLNVQIVVINLHILKRLTSIRKKRTRQTVVSKKPDHIKHNKSIGEKVAFVQYCRKGLTITYKERRELIFTNLGGSGPLILLKLKSLPKRINRE